MAVTRTIGICGTTFEPSRNRDGPAEVLATYQGVLQTDGYAVYESLVKEAPGRLRAAGCWMHARRGFDEARYTTSHPVMEETLARIQLLYDIEDRAKEMTAPERHALRRVESRPIVDRLFARWQEVRPELASDLQVGRGDRLCAESPRGAAAIL